MWPLGHAAVAYLCYALSIRTRSIDSPAALPVVAVLVGSQVPDLIDKPLSWYLLMLPTGRSLGHSFLFLAPLAIGVWLLARRYGRREAGFAFAIGAFAHPIVDVIPGLWRESSAGMLLWPITPVYPYEEGPPTIAELLAGSTSDPYFLLEFVLAAVALVVWHRHGRPGVDAIRTRVGARGPELERDSAD
ncbi:metal-dependent hydrolase [Halovivax cerinus]|uniref:Metal-dependent hydrolase n=1 Tax=Halovivax cerinus TaxID=1487865 RepID=A0ABD5NQB3_9EURY|nr:metal-dependent hydrolase [Halovivax cerinus]